MKNLPVLALLVAALIALAPTTATANDCRGGQCRVERVRMVAKTSVTRVRGVARRGLWFVRCG